MLSIRTTLTGIVGALIVILGSGQAVKAEPLRIAVSTWVGYGPLYVAQEEDFFADEGIDVHLIKIETGTFEALINGQVDAWASEFSSIIAQQPADERTVVCVFALDDSAGGDGVVATHDIQSIADLNGKTVAFDDDTVGELYLNVLLGEVG